MFNTIALVFNAFVNSIAIEAIAWKYYLVYVVFLGVITTVVYLFYAETTGLSLEQISAVFDGPLIVASLFNKSENLAGYGSESQKDANKSDKDVVEHVEQI